MNRPADKLEFEINIDREKAAARQEKLAELRAVAPDQRQSCSGEILAILEASKAWQAACSPLLYYPLRSEPDLSPLFADRRRTIVLPRVTENGLELRAYSGDKSLRSSRFGMLEPDPDNSQLIPSAQIDLAIIPGLAFDPDSGIRLGRGGGYYDRLLADTHFSAMTIGVGFEFQIQRGLPAEPHDRPLAYLLSESGLRPTRAASARTQESG
ncbi:MAG: 5-formyltetrahydrofolate cyclo-ligase [Verrucomicrobiales bacterium]